MPEQEKRKFSAKERRDGLPRAQTLLHQMRSMQPDLTQPVDLASFLEQSGRLEDEVNYLLDMARSVGFPMPHITRPQIETEQSANNGLFREPAVVEDASATVIGGDLSERVPVKLAGDGAANQPAGIVADSSPVDENLVEDTRPEITIAAPAIIKRRIPIISDADVARIMKQVTLSREQQPSSELFARWAAENPPPLTGIPSAQVTAQYEANKVGREVFHNLDAYVLEETDDALFMDKPAGMFCRASQISEFGLEAIVRERRGQQVNLVSGLGMQTTGVVAFAKNPDAFWHMKGQFLAREEVGVEEKFFALLDGTFPNGGLRRIEAPIAQTSTGRAKIIRSEADMQGIDRAKVKNSVTLVEPLLLLSPADGPFRTLAEMIPFTDCHDQLRVIAASLKAPVAGDIYYGREERRGIPRQMLHALNLRLLDKNNDEKQIHAPIPQDFSKAIGKHTVEKRYR